MPQPREDRKFYIRAPDLEFRPGGPIQVGNIIKNIFLPQDTISKLVPLPELVSGAPFSMGDREREHHLSFDVGLGAKIFEAFGGRGEAKGEGTSKTEYSYNRIDPEYLKSNPTPKDANALREKDTEVKAALKKGPVYIVSGLKTVKGLKYRNKQTKEVSIEAEGHGHVTEEAAVEGHMRGAIGEGNQESYNIIGDTILAYRLHIIKPSWWKWLGNSDLEVRSYDPGRAGFMNLEEEKRAADVEVQDITSEDVNGFAYQMEYEDIRIVECQDEEGEWSLICAET